MSKGGLGFTVLSAVGFFIDLTFMALLVHTSIGPGLANFISANAAATFVYWTSRALIYKVNFSKKALYGYIIYVLYTAAVVAMFSVLIQFTATELYDLLPSNVFLINLTSVALFVKLFYTPFNLALNYLVSYKLAVLTTRI